MSENEQWATVDLMGHAQTAGRISMENGLLRVDVPEGQAFRTEFYGLAAIYSIKIVSEEIARAYSRVEHQTYMYDAPIVTRDEHRAALQKLEHDNGALHYELQELRRRLTSVGAQPPLLPGGPDYADDEDDLRP